MVPHRRGLPGPSGVAALACGFLLSGLWPGRWLAAGRRPVHVRGVWQAYVSDRRHGVRPDENPADGVVQRLLAVRHEQGRRFGAEPAAHTGDRLLPERLGDAAPLAFGPRALGARAADRE